MDLERLGNNASAIINMFKNVFNTPMGIDLKKTLLYASGLAGYACHQVVKINKEPYELVKTVDGKNFYMGDSVNKYLLGGRYSILSFCDGFFQSFGNGGICPDPVNIVRNTTSAIGNNDYKIWNEYLPQNVYIEINKCWNGIFNNMIAKYCESPEEWPVLFAIVLQKVMIMASKMVSPAELYRMSLECAVYISKMDNDSI